MVMWSKSTRRLDSMSLGMSRCLGPAELQLQRQRSAPGLVMGLVLRLCQHLSHLEPQKIRRRQIEAGTPTRSQKDR